MTILHKIVAAILAALLLFGAGWFSRGKEIQTVQLPPQVVTKTETQVQEKIVNHTVTQTVVKTVKVPSGATTTTTTTVVTADQTKDKGREKATDELQPVADQQPARPDWSVGVSWTPRLSPAAEYPSGVEVSRRVIGPAWITGQYNWQQHQAAVGVRVEL